MKTFQLLFALILTVCAEDTARNLRRSSYSYSSYGGYGSNIYDPDNPSNSYTTGDALSGFTRVYKYAEVERTYASFFDRCLPEDLDCIFESKKLGWFWTGIFFIICCFMTCFPACWKCRRNRGQMTVNKNLTVQHTTTPMSDPSYNAAADFGEAPSATP